MVGTSTQGATVADPSLGFEERVAALKAVADPTRLRVLDSLAASGPRCHCELEEELEVPANRLSFHLKVLREAGLVSTERHGRLVQYRVDPDGLRLVGGAIPSAAEKGAP